MVSDYCPELQVYEESPGSTDQDAVTPGGATLGTVPQKKYRYGLPW